MSTPIPMSTSLIGRLAGDPRLRYSANGTAYVRVRVDVFPPRRRSEDGQYVKTDPVACDLVAFAVIADVLHNRFRFGDWFIASGRLKDGRSAVPSFIVSRIGHDAVNAVYTLRRTRLTRARKKAARSTSVRDDQPIVAGLILPERTSAARTA
jgi:hypothetical protein